VRGRGVRSSASSGASARHVYCRAVNQRQMDWVEVTMSTAEQLINVLVSVQLELGRESREWVVENVERGETYRNILGACLP
jgi:hypothetical protein